MRAKKPGIHDESLRQKLVRLPDDLYVLAVSNTLKVLCSQITRFIAKNEKKGNRKIRLTRSSQSLLWHDSCWRRLALKLASLQQQQQPQPWRAPYVGRRSIRGHRSYTVSTYLTKPLPISCLSNWAKTTTITNFDSESGQVLSNYCHCHNLFSANLQNATFTGTHLIFFCFLTRTPLSSQRP